MCFIKLFSPVFCSLTLESSLINDFFFVVKHRKEAIGRHCCWWKSHFSTGYDLQNIRPALVTFDCEDTLFICSEFWSFPQQPCSPQMKSRHTHNEVVISDDGHHNPILSLFLSPSLSHFFPYLGEVGLVNFVFNIFPLFL